MKRCPRCGETKPTTEFCKDRRKRDGLQSHCRLCQLAFNREWAERHPEVSRAVWRRKRCPPRVRDPRVQLAHGRVRRAVRRGDLVRPSTCSACGKSNSPITAHHPDYDQPLVVIWLCNRCHMRLHWAAPLAPAGRAFERATAVLASVVDTPPVRVGDRETP